MSQIFGYTKNKNLITVGPHSIEQLYTDLHFLLLVFFDTVFEASLVQTFLKISRNLHCDMSRHQLFTSLNNPVSSLL